MKVPFFNEDGQLSIEAENIYDEQSQNLLKFSEKSSLDSIMVATKEMIRNSISIFNSKKMNYYHSYTF